MELVFETKTASWLQPVIRQTRSQEETAEIIVPDSCPDIGRIVFTGAAAVLRQKECRAGSALVTGGVRAAVLCMPEDNSGPRVLDAYLPFSLRFDQPGVTDETRLSVQLQVRSADARLIHSRKALVRVTVGCTAEGWNEAEETFPAIQDPPEALQLKKQSYPLLLPSEQAEKAFVLSEELELPAGKPDAARVCFFDARPAVLESKLVGSKAVFKGVLDVHLLYLSPEGGADVFSQQLPFSQYCELRHEYDEDALAVVPAVTGAELEPDGEEGRRFLLTVQVTAQCLASAVRQEELCEDAYAVKGRFTPEWREYQLDCRLDGQTLRAPLQGAVKAPARAVVDSAVYLGEIAQERTAGGVRVRVPASVNVLYLDEQGALQGASGAAEAVCETALAENGVCFARASLAPGGFAAPAAGGAEPRCDVLLELGSSAKESLRTLSGGTLEEEEKAGAERPSVVLLRSRTRQPVWNLAKKYGTTVEAIRQANRLEADLAEEGELLLIPM
jgi:hypothetical protein